LEFSVGQARINAKEEGAEKTLAQNKLNHQKEVEQIKRQKEELLKQIQDRERTIWESEHPDWEKKEMKFTPKTTRLSDEDDKQFKELNTEASKKFEAENKKVWDGLATEYGNYLEKRAVLTAKWEKIIAETPLQFQAGAKAERDKEIAGLDDEYHKVSETLESLFDNTANRSVSEMREIADEAERMYEALDRGSYDPSFGITEEQFNTLADSPEEMKKIAAAIKEMRKEADDSENAFNKVSRSLKEIFSAGDDKKKLRDGFKALADGLGEINDLAQSVGNNISSIFSAFGNDEAAEMASNITNLIGGVGQAGAGIAKLASGDIIGGIKDSVSGITSVVTSIINLGNSKNEKQIQALQKEYDAVYYQISLIDRRISKLQKEASNAFGSDKSDLIYKENEELEKEIQNRNKQISIIQNQIKQERSKKGSDDDRIATWNKEIEAERQAIADLRDEIKENKVAAFDALFGSDIKSAIENFSQAYADAWTGGTERAKDMKKVVRDLMRSYVLEMIKADAGLEDAIKRTREKIDEYLQDGILDATEQNMLDSIITQATSNLDSKYGNLMDIFKDDEARQASQKGFASISQDSANELNGRFTAIQAHTYTITENMRILVANSNQILRHIAGIESNTEYCKRLDGMDYDLKAARNGIETINLKGVIIKK
jgi:hypothetical protein